MVPKSAAKSSPKPRVEVHGSSPRVAPAPPKSTKPPGPPPKGESEG